LPKSLRSSSGKAPDFESQLRRAADAADGFARGPQGSVNVGAQALAASPQARLSQALSSRKVQPQQQPAAYSSSQDRDMLQPAAKMLSPQDRLAQALNPLSRAPAQAPSSAQNRANSDANRASIAQQGLSEKHAWGSAASGSAGGEGRERLNDDGRFGDISQLQRAHDAAEKRSSLQSVTETLQKNWLAEGRPTASSQRKA
jgi:hypothetical protein